jgi:hypothetical protein
MKQQETLLFSEHFSTNRKFYFTINNFIKNILQTVKIYRFYGVLEVAILHYLLLTASCKETDDVYHNGYRRH